jgi:geranylgeranylglycerol-phosphate geranylgeranyltransferase
VFAKQIAVLLVTRPLNVAIGALSVALGAALAQPPRWSVEMACAVISAALILAGANVINDYFDIDIDRINRPQRMLPSGRLHRGEALGLAIFLFACGFFFSILTTTSLATIAVLTSGALIWYSADLKRRPIVGNVAVSAVTAVAFLYGAQAGGRWQAGITPATFAFLMHLGREIIKDIEDRLGDAHGQARTLPLVHGLTAAQWSASVALAALLLIILVPFWRGEYNRTYLLITLGGVYPVVLHALYRLWKEPSAASMRRVSAMLKADMLVGLAAIFWGR